MIARDAELHRQGLIDDPAHRLKRVDEAAEILSRHHAVAGERMNTIDPLPKAMQMLGEAKLKLEKASFLEKLAKAYLDDYSVELGSSAKKDVCGDDPPSWYRRILADALKVGATQYAQTLKSESQMLAETAGRMLTGQKIGEENPENVNAEGVLP